MIGLAMKHTRYIYSWRLTALYVLAHGFMLINIMYNLGLFYFCRFRALAIQPKMDFVRFFSA